MKKIFSILVAVLVAVLSNVAYAADIDYVDFLSKGNAVESMTVEGTLRHEADANSGRTMANGQEGCTEAAVMLGSKVSPVLAAAKEAGVVYNPSLVAFAQGRGIAVTAFVSANLEAGDIIFFGTPNDPLHHAMLYIGNGKMAGNNSYLYGKDGKGGIWTLNVSDYSVYAPQLVLKTGAHVVGMHEVDRSAFVDIHEAAERDCGYADDVRTELMLALLLAVVIRFCTMVFSCFAEAKTADSVENAVFEDVVLDGASFDFGDAVIDDDVVLAFEAAEPAVEEAGASILAREAGEALTKDTKSVCLHTWRTLFILARWVQAQPPLASALCPGMTLNSPLCACCVT